MRFSLFVGSSSVSIGFLLFGIYKIYAEKLALKIRKSLDKSRLFAWASFLVPSYGRGKRTRTHRLISDAAATDGASHPALLYTGPDLCAGRDSGGAAPHAAAVYTFKFLCVRRTDEQHSHKRRIAACGSLSLLNSAEARHKCRSRKPLRSRKKRCDAIIASTKCS